MRDAVTCEGADATNITATLVNLDTIRVNWDPKYRLNRSNNITRCNTFEVLVAGYANYDAYQSRSRPLLYLDYLTAPGRYYNAPYYPELYYEFKIKNDLNLRFTADPSVTSPVFYFGRQG